MKTHTTQQVTILSSPACSPQYYMIVPAGTEVDYVDGSPVVADAGLHRVRGGNAHDHRHYYVWLPPEAFQ